MPKSIDMVGCRWRLQTLFKELRPRQWMKNLILFLPLIAAHQFDLATVLPVALAALAFSLAASAIYILNDLLDLEADRVHPEKRQRPLASGNLPIRFAMVASGALVFLALSLAFAVGPPVAAWTFLYMAGSLSYSLWLKRLRWFDVVTLAFLFLIRILAGASAAGITIPLSLLAACMAALLALACVKRVTALSRLRFDGCLPGRGYTSADLLRLEHLAYAMVPVAGALFLFYAFGPAAQELYASPALLSLAILPVLIWLLRIIRLSALGREDYDPLRFVLGDGPGFAILLLAAALILSAA